MNLLRTMIDWVFQDAINSISLKDYLSSYTKYYRLNLDIRITCSECGQFALRNIGNFKVRKSGKYFCTRDCFFNHYYRNKRITKICNGCGNEFQVYASKSYLRCCSPECRSLSVRRQKEAWGYHCLYCNKQLFRSRSTYNMKANYCSLECSIKHKTVEIPELSRLLGYDLAKVSPGKRYHQIRKYKAFKMISPNLHCCNCGCDVYVILQVNHRNGNGAIDYRQNRSLFHEIMMGRRKVDDLEIRCNICNILHFVQDLKGYQGFTVTYTKPKPTPPILLVQPPESVG